MKNKIIIGIIIALLVIITIMFIINKNNNLNNGENNNDNQSKENNQNTSIIEDFQIDLVYEADGRDIHYSAYIPDNIDELTSVNLFIYYLTRMGRLIFPRGWRKLRIRRFCLYCP